VLTLFVFISWSTRETQVTSPPHQKTPSLGQQTTAQGIKKKAAIMDRDSLVYMAKLAEQAER
jgi:hypothetical protein